MSTAGRGAERRAQDVGDQVGFGVVILAYAIARTGDVEVPQADRAQPGRRAEIADHQVDGELRGAVGVDRPGDGRLADRDLVRLPVHRAGRGEHQARNAGGRHRLEQVQGPAHVRAVVALGVADRLRHERQRGEVHDAVESALERRVDRLAIEQIRDDEVCAIRDGGAVALLEVVEHDHLVAGGEQLPSDDRADVARAARDEQLHLRRLTRRSTDLMYGGM